MPPSRTTLSLVVLLASIALSTTCRPEAPATPTERRHQPRRIEQRHCKPFDLEAADAKLEAASDPHDPEVADHLARYAGCPCRHEPDATSSEDSGACGPFPCTVTGCYVQQCETDADCAYGFCAAHTGWPDAWCVTSDDR